MRDMHAWHACMTCTHDMHAWYHSRVILVSSWDHSGLILGLYQVNQGSIWGHSGSLRCHSRVISGSFWDHSRIIPGSGNFLEFPGICPGIFQEFRECPGNIREHSLECFRGFPGISWKFPGIPGNFRELPEIIPGNSRMQVPETSDR